MSDQINEIVNDMLDNAGFEEAGDVEMAKRFVTAATKYLILTPAQQSDQGTSLTMSVNQIENLIIRARAYININARRQGGTGTRFLNGREGFRR